MTRPFRLSDRRVDLERSVVEVGGVELRLTTIEARLLGYLARRPGRIVPKDELLTEVWGYRAGVQTRTVDATAGRLRTKIEPDPSDPRHLFVVYGRGLRLDGVVPIGVDDVDRFVGRGELLADLVDRVQAGQRLLVLLGPGGVGKSRLAHELRAQIVQASVCVPCGGVRSATELDAAVIRALDPAAEGASSVAARLGRAGPLVVVLDECEGCAAVVAQRAPGWLADAPALQLVVTSRVRLDLPIERVVRVEPLEEDEALELLVARAGPIDPAAARAIVRAVDGLPLAVELAAARCQLVDPVVLPALLRSPLEVLVARGRASMAEVLERSFALCPPDDRRALTCAATFEDGFDLDGFAAVCAAPVATAVQRLDALVAQSLVHVGGAPRYRLFTVVRERARRDLLPDDPAWEAHGRWFARLGSPEHLVACGADLAASEGLRRAAPDLRAAFERLAVRAPELAGPCGLAAVRQLARDGAADEAIALAARVEPVLSDDRSRVVCALTVTRCLGGRGDSPGAERYAARAAALATHPDDRVLAQVAVAVLLRNRGDRDGAARELERARPWVDRGRPTAAEWLQKVGSFATDAASARAALSEAASVARRHGDVERELMSLVFLADSELVLGAWTELVGLRSRLIELGSVPGATASRRAGALFSAGRIDLLRGRLDEAEQWLEEAAELARACSPVETLPKVIRIEIARAWMLRDRLDDAAAELEGMRWDPVHPSFPAASAHLAWAEIALRRGDLAPARAALVAVLTHAEPARFDQAARDAHDLLAVIDRDPARFDRGPQEALDPLRRMALIAWVAAARAEPGDLVSRAREAIAAAGLGAASDAAQWLKRAEALR